MALQILQDQNEVSPFRCGVRNENYAEEKSAAKKEPSYQTRIVREVLGQSRQGPQKME
jgi:hypothetical protein